MWLNNFKLSLQLLKNSYTEWHTVITTRTKCKSAKRKSLEGQVLVSRVEFVEEFAKQEQATKDRKKGKGTKRKRESTPEVEEQLT